MFRKKFFFTKLVILLCLLSLIHGRKCFVKPKNKVIKIPNKNIDEIETAIPLKNEIDSESDSDSESENNIKTITNSQSIDTIISTIEISSSTIEIPTSTIEISSNTPIEISSTTIEISSTTIEISSSIPIEISSTPIDVSSSTPIEISSTTIDISSSTSVPMETESSVFTSTTENDEPTSTFSPIPTETIDEYEEPTEYELKVKLEITEEIKDTLKDLKNKYPEYFKNYKSSSDFICDDQCFLNKLALVKLSNDIKSFIDEYKNLMNELLLYKYERYNYPLYHNYLPHDDACYYNAAVHPINRDKDYSGFFYIYTYSNDDIMERVTKHFEKNIVSCRNVGVIELEDFDF